MKLIYLGSKTIVQFCFRNPIEWGDREKANGPGNVLTPEPVAQLFFEKITKDETLFSQAEFWQYISHKWNDWLRQQKPMVQEGLRHRIYRNFYPSFIDSLHAWSLLCESGYFAYCILDSERDAVSKTDITVVSFDGVSIRVGLRIDTTFCNQWTNYKRQYRGDVGKIIDVVMPMNRPREPGNKRWYCIDDFMPVIAVAESIG